MKKFIFVLLLIIIISSFNSYKVLSIGSSNPKNNYENLVIVKDINVLINDLKISYDIPKRIRIATGTVKNISNTDLECLTVIITYYDKDNKIVGRRGDGTGRLSPNKTWNFSTIICDKHIVRFEVSEIYYELRNEKM